MEGVINMSTQAGFFESLHRLITAEELLTSKAEQIAPGLWKFPDQSVGRTLKHCRFVFEEGAMVAAIYFEEVDLTDIEVSN